MYTDFQARFFFRYSSLLTHFGSKFSKMVHSPVLLSTCSNSYSHNSQNNREISVEFIHKNNSGVQFVAPTDSKIQSIQPQSLELTA